jgi:hypothetical protein
MSPKRRREQAIYDQRVSEFLRERYTRAPEGDAMSAD